MTDSAADGRVVVVGGGVAGVSTAAALRRLGHQGQVLVLESGPAPHDRPPLSKGFLQGTATADDVVLYPGDWYHEHDVGLRTGVSVAALDLGRALLVLDDGSELAYGSAVLAQGAVARPLPVPGGELALTLRWLPDAVVLRSALASAEHLVVVGAGLVGAEVTATARALGVRVTLVDPDPLPLARVVGDVVARVLHADHDRHGVHVLRRGVVALERAGAAVLVRLDDGEELVADAVLAATGLRSRDDLAAAAGLQVAVDGGVLVDAAQRTSAAGVLAVGDGAAGPLGGRSTPVVAGHWDAARLDGETAAAVLLGQEPPPRPTPWFWTDRYGRHVEVVGEVVARSGEAAGGTTARTVVRGEPGPGPFGVLVWAEGLLVGAVTVDDPTTARAVRRLVDRRTVVDPDALADPATDLRALLRR